MEGSEQKQTFSPQKQAMIKAMYNNLGIVTKAAKEAGIARVTHYDWFNNDPAYKAEIESISDVVIDFAEGKLLELVERKDVISTIFYLKTKGKRRGFIEKSELDVSGQITVDWKEEKSYKNSDNLATGSDTAI